MSKSKLLIFAVISLFVINIITLLFFVIKDSNKKPRHDKGPRRSPKDFVIEKLEFDKEQVASYESTIKKHGDSVTKIDKEIFFLKNSLYNELSNSSNKKLTDSLFVQIANNQSIIEKLHYNHFLEIKKICKPEQLNNYKSLTNELTKLFSSQKPQKPQHSEDHP